MHVEPDEIAYRLSAEIKNARLSTRVFQEGRKWCVAVKDKHRSIGVVHVFDHQGEIKVDFTCSKQKSMFKRWAAIGRRLIRQQEGSNHAQEQA